MLNLGSANQRFSLCFLCGNTRNVARVQVSYLKKQRTTREENVFSGRHGRLLEVLDLRLRTDNSKRLVRERRINVAQFLILLEELEGVAGIMISETRQIDEPLLDYN